MMPIVQDSVETEENESIDEESVLEEQARKKEQKILKQSRMEMFSISDEAGFYQYILPNEHYQSIQCCNSRVYGGRFTSRGNIYYCSSQ
jgi:WD repeat-containing protein 23